MAQYEKYAITAQRLTGIADQAPLSELPYSRVCATIRGITEQAEKQMAGTDSAVLSKGESYDF